MNPEIDNALLPDIERHYLHAKTKHPYFADTLAAEYQLADGVAGLSLALIRDELQKCAKDGNLPATYIAACEIHEFIEALANGDKKAAREEALDIIAVWLRVIDVLDGRQILGNPQQGERKQ